MYVLIGKSTAVRLMGPLASSGTGRLSVFHSGQWGTICADSWDLNSATVACRQLGYKAAGGILRESHNPRHSGKIWLDDVNCTGSEQTLNGCLHGGWGNHNCSRRQDAAVQCSSTGKVTVKLNIVFKFS